jgi:hypothetical protein
MPKAVFSMNALAGKRNMVGKEQAKAMNSR